MKCEHCGIHDATFFCKTNINGRVSQVHLCPDCAEKLGYTHSFEQALRRSQRRLFDPFSLLGDFGMMPKTMLTEFPAPTEELKGKVVDCTKKGYTMNGKVLRFAQVVVGV